MKMPFRQQASYYDCVPTTVINGLSYLFNIGEIPPFVVHRVYKDCLDAESFRGTSSRAIQDLAFWLNHYQDKRYKGFAVESEYVYGDKVHLKRNSKILQCLNSNGVALLCPHTTRNEWHCILCFRSEGEWLYCYDPFPRTKRFINDEAVKFVEPAGRHDANLIIHFDWLDKNFNKTKSHDERKYVFGSKSDRECLLLNRIKR